MSQVEFNDERNASVYNKFQTKSEIPTLARWVMSAGLAKTPEKANVVLVIIAIIAVILTLFVVNR